MKKKFETVEVWKVHIHWVSGDIENIWMLLKQYDSLADYVLHYNMEECKEPFTIIEYYRTFEELKEKKTLEAYINVNNIEKIAGEYPQQKQR